MADKNLETRLREIDWRQYSGPDLYAPDKLIASMLALINLHDQNASNAVGDAILNTLGNNHRGVYYPAALAALDLLINMAEAADQPARMRCARSILNDLYYFEPELGYYDGCSDEELKRFVCTKLQPYSDAKFSL
ncbi:hypothetical protein EUZ85_19995 [Hahella sp. KA22]|uniref:hypothetical protein n=1 Tax=Hahella sp. KA22 TaxID=1628392 RepID=UPI000FDEDC84|nr:hypothetical protein [Hahella sp. KA22]AZZ92883.1 hypothetical protein ENC22_17415 [Hahella sp. KA22]QAY56257.1 hypothetical protein EUZ85_19995 [Hahella sp. KA22]